ncbi:MAG TPA: Ig-like domain-containing protein [Caulobacteraceae bacterium]
MPSGPSPYHWRLPAPGDFATVGDWSTGVVPGAADTAYLDVAGVNYTVTVSVNTNVNSLVTAANATLDIVGAGVTFTASSGTGGGASAGTIIVENHAAFDFGGTFDNTGLIDLKAANFSADLVVSGATTLDGGGAVTLSDSANNQIFGNSSTDSLTNVDNTISGAGQIGAGSLTLVNQSGGVIDAIGVHALVIDTTGVAVTNAHLLESTNPGALGSVGGLQIVDTTVTNSATGVIEANGAGTHVDLIGATISGGTLMTPNGGAINTVFGNTATLDSTTLAINNDGLVNVVNGSNLTLLGPLTNSGQIVVGGVNADTHLYIGAAGPTGAVSLKGGGTVTLAGDNAHNIIVGQGGTNTLTNVDNTINGGGLLGDGQLNLVNDASGTIDATLSYGLTISTGAGEVINYGVIEASSGSSLTILNSTVDNSGGGTLYAQNSTIFLSGADIIGGALNNNGGDFFVPYGPASTLDGSSSTVTNNSVIYVSDNSSLTIGGTIYNDSQISLNASSGGSTLIIAPVGATLNGYGQVTLTDNAGNQIEASGTGAVTLTNVNNTISGAGHLGDANLTLDNEASGVIDASGFNNPLIIDTGANAVINTGLIEATGAGGLTIHGTTVDNAGGNIYANSATVTLDGADIVGGNLNSSSVSITTLSGSTATIDGATNGSVDSHSQINVADSSSLTITGTIDNYGQISLNANTGVAELIIGPAGATLDGGSLVTLGDNTGNHIDTGGGGAVTLTNVNDTISGAGQLGDANLTLDNQLGGTIDAVGINPLVIDTGANTIVNDGILEATSGGTLQVNSAVSGAGTVDISNGTVDFTTPTFNQNVDFLYQYGSETLELANSHGYTTGTINGFASDGGSNTDTLDLRDINPATAYASFSGSSGGGVLTVTDGTHTANLNLTGADYTNVTFSTSSDNMGTPGTLVIISGPPPLTSPDSYTITENQPLTVAAPGVLANDSDPNNLPITATLNTGPSNGSLGPGLGSDGSFTYTPNPGFAGVDSFTYVATDNFGSSAPTTVTINVSGPPTSLPDSYADGAGKTLTVTAPGVLANDTDNNGLPLTATLNSPASHGTVTLNADGSFTYVPTLGFAGADTFSYIASDSSSPGAPTTVTVNVTASAPTTVADSYNDTAGHTLNVAASGVLSNDADNNGLPLKAAVASGPADGVLTVNADGSFAYTPNKGFAGTDSFTYIASDSLASAPPTKVSLNVTASPPTSTADVYGASAGHTLIVNTAGGVLANDTDNNGLALTAAVSTAPSHGVVSINSDGSFDYTPTLGFAGADTFKYIASDSLSSGAPTTVTVNVAANAPTSIADAYADGAAKTLTVTAANGVLANDTDNNGLPLTAALAGAPTHGTLTLNSNGSFVYVSTPGFAGTDSFKYVASDGISSGAPTTVTLNITASPPTSMADGYADGAGHALAVNVASGLLANDTDNNGLALTAAVATAPTHGAVTVNADGSFNYTPTVGFAGVDTFTYKASDSLSTGAPTTVTVDVIAASPTSVADSYTDPANTTLTVAAASGVLSNDTDNNGLTLTAALSTGPAHGSVTFNPDGSFNYTPAASFSGADSFKYIAVDSLSAGVPTTVTVNVTGGAGAPVSNPDTYGDGAGHTLTTTAANGVLANDTDPNSLPLTATLNTGPADGTVTLNKDGSFNYTPTLGFAGTDTFTYIASDGKASGASTLVTINVAATAPTSAADSYGDGAGHTLTTTAANGVLANDTDNNGLTLTAAVATGPAHGAVTVNPDGSFSYTPTLGYAGADSFTYIASDSLSTGAPTTVSLTVTASAPTSVADSYSDPENTTLTAPAAGGVLANDTDNNGLTLTAALATGPAHGAVSLNADGSFSYTPTTGFTGKDSFTYIPADSLSTGVATTVNLTVTAIGVGPMSNPDFYTDTPGQALVVLANKGVLANDTDTNHLALRAALAPGGGPTHGTVTLNAVGAFRYVPTAGFVGADTFTYIASDKNGPGAPTLVTITVSAGAPHSNPDSYADGAGHTLTTTAANGVLANDTDPNGLTLTASEATGPAHGALTLNKDGSFSYTPALGFAGQDSFTYVASDGAASAPPTTVTLTVNATAPTSNPDSYSDGVGHTLTVPAGSGLLANDVDNNGLALTAAVATGPAHGSVTVNPDGSFSYAPAAGFVGKDSFTYVASDSLSSGAPTTVTVAVTSGAPTVNADAYGDGAGHTLSVNAASGVLANDTDPNGLALTAALVAAPAHGAVTLNADGSFSYTPTLGFAGKDSFTYQASDGAASSAVTTVSLTVSATAPTSVPDSYNGPAGHVLTVTAGSGVLANDADNNGLPLTAGLSAAPAHGTVSLSADGSFAYTPAAGFVGKDSFSYVASDSLASGAPTTVSLNITAAGPPVSNPDTYLDTAGQTLVVTAAAGVLANDTDPNGLALTAALAGGPAHGAVTLNTDGSFSYTPTSGFVGKDSFTYVASDGSASGQPTLVTLNVAAGAPTAQPDSYNAVDNQLLTVSAKNGVLANDTDPNGLPLTAQLAAHGGPTHGTLTLNTDGSFTYIARTGHGGFTGTDTFTYIATDGHASSAPTTVTIHITTAPSSGLATAGGAAHSAFSATALSAAPAHGAATSFQLADGGSLAFANTALGHVAAAPLLDLASPLATVSPAYADIAGAGSGLGLHGFADPFASSMASGHLFGAPSLHSLASDWHILT